MDLVAVATDLENVMPRPTGTLLKEKKGKGKRKREKTYVEKQYQKRYGKGR